ncbi:MAG: hypothetical protein KF860_03160 [Cyclobacteriaceae bacterium]|nr:hypothetical protein [Cyclobacteriaceae bacterium]
MTIENLNQLRLELSIKAKNGMDFIFAAAIIWAAIGIVWTLPYTAYDKSILTFIVGSTLLPLALLFSKLFKTTWNVQSNPLQPLGLWLNFAQLFYFPFLIFILIKTPDYFVMTYAIITGAHFFPYAWYYHTLLYAFAAGLISIGALLLGVLLPVQSMYMIPLCLSAVLFVLFILIYLNYKKRHQLIEAQ